MEKNKCELSNISFFIEYLTDLFPDDSIKKVKVDAKQDFVYYIDKIFITVPLEDEPEQSDVKLSIISTITDEYVILFLDFDVFVSNEILKLLKNKILEEQTKYNEKEV